ncbi:hypothetical protein HG530_008452 [Fusarium avenaceum]|nr:hypothetical protein HG530_008452 [Fusarium avenaceum]
MPSSIPYDPSLVLANVVSTDALNYIDSITKANAPADAAQDNLNSLLSTRRSLEMTRSELVNAGIDDLATLKPLDDQLQALGKDITNAASEYASAKITACKTIQKARSAMKGVNASAESPVDYVKTQIKSMPLAADSVNMDVQYFSCDQEGQQSGSFAKSIGSFVSGALEIFGDNFSSQATRAASKQAQSQADNHDIAGTLVIAVSCTHKNASVLAPFVLNVDKAITTWNHIFKDSKDRLDPTDTKSLSAAANMSEADDNSHYSIVSGMTFGSSFVGMVHVLNSKLTQSSEKMSSIATSLQAQMEVGGWFESYSGGFGVNESFSNDVKNLLSTQNISSHVTMVCMGVIPTIAASNVKLGVEQFASFDPAKSMQSLAAFQNSTAADQNSVKSAADAARAGQQMISMRAGDIKAALSALSGIDDGSNSILDINSMMTALDDYLKKAANGACGVPINYYLKDISKKYLAEMWCAKYLPAQSITIQGDDSGGKTNTSSSPTDTPSNPDSNDNTQDGTGGGDPDTSGQPDTGADDGGNSAPGE